MATVIFNRVKDNVVKTRFIDKPELWTKIEDNIWCIPYIIPREGYYVVEHRLYRAFDIDVTILRNRIETIKELAQCDDCMAWNVMVRHDVWRRFERVSKKEISYNKI